MQSFCGAGQPALEELEKARGANASIASGKVPELFVNRAHFLDSEVGDFVGIQVTDPTVNVSRLF